MWCCCGVRHREGEMPSVACDRSLLWLVLSVVSGVLIGIIAPRPTDGADPPPWGLLSWILGWSYFMCWSVSFWPQIILNYQRKSTAGLSFDFQLLNFIGFACYATFNCSLFWSTRVQQEYADRNGGHSSAVRLNDVLFSLHAVFATLITLAQIFMYGTGTEAVTTLPQLDEWSASNYPVYLSSEENALTSAAILPPPRQSSVSRNIQKALYIVLSLFCLTVAVLVTLCAVDEHLVGIEWLDVLYVLSSAKVVITVIKYIPQVWENWRRKSTKGWNIWNVLLDLSGAIGSFGQLLMDCASTGIWDRLSGDPAKLMLGNVSLVFDAIFIVQHYCLYGPEKGRRGAGCCCRRRTDGDDDMREPLNLAQDIDWMEAS